MWKMAWLAAVVLLSGVLVTAGVRAQTTVDIWPGVAPGSEHWTWKAEVDRHVVANGRDIGTIIENVVTPTLTAYLPARSNARHAGIVIAPGGACIALAMRPANELARWLEQKGIAAFVLKYRLQHKRGAGMPGKLSEDRACRWGVADAAQALKLVRARAREWNISPQRVGIVGFSAGGMLASELLIRDDPALRPDFAALIYGAPFESMPKLRSKLPPVFMAWAQDDAVAGYAMRRFYAALLAAGNAPEAHIYHDGGHGFAMAAAAGSSGHWRQEFYWWLEAEGFAEPAR